MEDAAFLCAGGVGDAESVSGATGAEDSEAPFGVERGTTRDRPTSGFGFMSIGRTIDFFGDRASKMIGAASRSRVAARSTSMRSDFGDAVLAAFVVAAVDNGG